MGQMDRKDQGRKKYEERIFSAIIKDDHEETIGSPDLHGR